MNLMKFRNTKWFKLSEPVEHGFTIIGIPVDVVKSNEARIKAKEALEKVRAKNNNSRMVGRVERR